MSRKHRVAAPPSNVTDETLRQWMWQVTDAINGMPDMIPISGDPNVSGVTANGGVLGINVASGATQRLWVQQSDGTNTWSWLSYI